MLNHVVVPAAWVRGDSGRGGAMFTDGRTLYSYGHIIGVTTGDGRKVAYDCHASRTTARHSNGAAAVADSVLESCPSCDGD